MHNILKRIRQRLIRSAQSRGLFLRVRFFGMLSKPSENLRHKLLIVAPGEISVPPDGWGAVETIIWETLHTYEDAGFEVWLLNSKHPSDWKDASKIKFDVILNHCDIFSKKIKSKWPLTKIVSISHYGFAAFPEKWDKNYKFILEDLEVSDYIICLSPQIKSALSDFLPNNKLVVSSNGTSFKPQLAHQGSRKIICVGKIETRKKQFELYRLLENSGIEVDFYGPIADTRVLNELSNNQEMSNRFKGPISRDKLAKTLCNYGYLILPSSGEADALVLYEAQMAGVEIIVEENAVGAQNPKLDWVHLISEVPTLSEIKEIIDRPRIAPSQIMEFAQKNYPWEVRNSLLVKILIRCLN